MIPKFFRNLKLYGTDEHVVPVVNGRLAREIKEFLDIQPNQDNIIATVPFVDVALGNSWPSQHPKSMQHAIRHIFKAEKLADFMTRLFEGNDWSTIRFLAILICIVNSDESQYQRLAGVLEDDWVDEATIVWEEFEGGLK